MKNKVYKIRNSKGLFSPGGTETWYIRNIDGTPRLLEFKKEGKVWLKIGHAKGPH